MKGDLNLNWLYITLLVVSLIAAFMLSSFNTFTNSAALLNSKEIAYDLSGVINLLMASPGMACYEYKLPKSECTITFNKFWVSVEIPKSDKIDSSFAKIKGEGLVLPTEILCDNADEKIILIKSDKKEGKVTVIEGDSC